MAVDESAEPNPSPWRDLAGFLKTWTGYVIMAATLGLLGLLFHGYALGAGAQRSSEVLRACLPMS